MTLAEQVTSPVAAPPQQQRVYSIDWMRVIMVLGVFFNHARDILSYQSHWDVFRYQPHQVGLAPRISYPPVPARDVFNFVAPLAMALFFGLSGASAWFSLRSRTERTFARERIRRLLVPLLVGMALLAPFGMYFEVVSTGRFHGPLWEYIPYFFQHISPNWSPRWIGSYFRHLWFLLDLFVFSLLGLPIFAYLRKVRHTPFMRHLTAIIERPGGLFVLVLPVAAIRLALGGAFPGYQDWTDTLCWMVFYVYGYYLISDMRRVRAIDAHGPFAVALALAAMAAAFGIAYSGFLVDIGKPLTYAPPALILQVLYALNMCAWLVAIVWLGNRLFTSGSKLLNYANRLLLMFYFVHYPILEATTFYIKPLQLPLYFTFAAIVGVAFAISVGLAHLLTSRGHVT